MKRKRKDRTYTEEQIDSISEFIETNIIEPYKHFQDKDFKQLIFSTAQEDGIELNNFRCSHSFVTNFKRENRFSSRKAHFKKRPAKQLTTIKEFKQDIKEKMELSIRPLNKWRNIPS